MILPEHKCGLYLTHNRHRDHYQSVTDWFAEPFNRREDVSDEEYRECIDTDSVWELQWYPDTPIGSYTVIAATLEAVLRKALECV